MRARLAGLHAAVAEAPGAFEADVAVPVAGVGEGEAAVAEGAFL